MTPATATDGRADRPLGFSAVIRRRPAPSPRPPARFLRRGAVPVGAVLLAAGLSSCGSVADNAVAATVGDGDVSRDEFETLLQGFSDPAVSASVGLAVDEATGTVPGEASRSLLAVLIQQEAVAQFLADAGEEITDADRAAFTDTLAEDELLFDLSEDVQRVVVDQTVAPEAVARVPAPDAAELERRYEEDPTSLGVLCVRHILTETEAGGEAVVAELEAGADFAELAAERSIDPTAADNGGVIQSSTAEPCMATSEATQRLDPTFVDAAFEATPSNRVGPVETSFGWHVIESVPYEDASASLAAMYETNAGQLLLDGHLRAIDVDVDPRYGVWDGRSQSVLPLA